MQTQEQSINGSGVENRVQQAKKSDEQSAAVNGSQKK